MKGIGNKTTGDGTLFSGPAVMRFYGPGVARQGDPAFCYDGVPVAFEGDRCASGFALIFSLPAASAS